MSDTNSHSQEYEVSGPDVAAVEPDEIPVIPAVASPGLLLRQILDRLTAVEEEVAELREENRQKDQRIAELEARLEDHESFDGRERATDRQRITALETRAPALREETAKDHLDKLFSEMRRLNIRQTTTKDAARLLGVSKPLIDKIIPHLAAAPRCLILRDPRHKQRHLIRLAGT
jgi:TolA-binding protein